MIAWRKGVVQEVRRRWRGAIEYLVTIDGETRTALGYPELVGEATIGDDVLLNTSAQTLGLGTGGYAFIIAIPDRLPADPQGPGHIVKGRYTPLQNVVLAVDEQDSPHHATIRDAGGIDDMPVIVADLHSALPAILAGIHADNPTAKVAYVMTDGGALPLWFSMTAAALSDQLVGTVTVGQAFGGELEAVTTHTGLLAAKWVLGADIAIVTQGPGNVGTGTPWGYSGVAAGETINAVAVLGGHAVASPRISDADARGRHTGISHHSLTAYGKVALASADIPIPATLPSDLAAVVAPGLAELAQQHHVVQVDIVGLDAALRASPVKLSTMGRGLDADYSYFLTAAVAGRHAVSLLSAAG